MNGNSIQQQSNNNTMVDVVLYYDYCKLRDRVEKLKITVEDYCGSSTDRPESLQVLYDVIVKLPQLSAQPVRIPDVHDMRGIVLLSDYSKLKVIHDNIESALWNRCRTTRNGCPPLSKPPFEVAQSQIVRARLLKRRSHHLLLLPLDDLLPITQKMDLAELIMMAQEGQTWVTWINENYRPRPNVLKLTFPHKTDLGDVTNWEIKLGFENGRQLIWQISEEDADRPRKMIDYLMEDELVVTGILRFSNRTAPFLYSAAQIGEKTAFLIVRWLERLWNLRLTDMAIPLKNLEQPTHVQVWEKVRTVENLHLFGHHLVKNSAVNSKIIGPRVFQGKKTKFDGLQFRKDVTISLVAVRMVFADFLVISKNNYKADDICVLISERCHQFQLLSFGLTHLTAHNISTLKTNLDLEEFPEKWQERYSVVRYRRDIRITSNDELYFIPFMTAMKHGEPVKDEVCVVRFRKSGDEIDAIIVGYHDEEDEDDDDE